MAVKMQLRAVLARFTSRPLRMHKLARKTCGNDTNRNSFSDKTSTSASYFTIEERSQVGESPNTSLQQPIHHQTDIPHATTYKTSAERMLPRLDYQDNAASEIARLSAINCDLAEHLEKAEQDLSRKHVSMAEMEESLVKLWEHAKEYEAKREKAEAENERLHTLVDRLSTSKWRPMRNLRKRLSDVATSLKVAESQIAAMKQIIRDLTRERNQLREDLGKAVSELYDKTMEDVERAGDRAGGSMFRSSVRSSFGGGYI
ncbi:hypothetical protein CERZMDRAFT_82444 [Cercospora zeae-maydis SCOH1-5]|uniref:Uncharacterized protein n=1 Tax=Cercospora zeae-maydis SCOH1-5 TaxID=717836 RepID=A0A6A6FPS5_9PEZI|nr:hypothetical protein CERZMDRAFT_82444 [Cercospora zeae-maydis SCOH1-5]